ncbi:MAG: ABC transporter substrate-binding protein [Desulfatiglandales bacterium]
MRSKKWVIGVLLAGFVAGMASPASAADLLDTIKKRGDIICGTTLGAPPFAYADSKGNPVGFEIDLITKLGEYMGVKVKIEDMAWAGQIPALLTGRIDVISSRMSATLERATKVVFTHPWLMTGTFAISHKSRGLKTWRDLNRPGMKVGAIAGSLGAILARKKLPQARLVTYELDGDMFKALKDGREHGGLNDELIVVMATKKYPELTVLEGNLQPDVYAYAVRPDFESYRLKNWLDLFFATIMRTGEYGEIYEKWIGKPWLPSWGLHP